MKQYEDTLLKYVTAAKGVLYADKKIFEKLLSMMKTEFGATTAVHTILATVDKHSKIPVDIAPMVAMSVLALLLSSFQKVYGFIPPRKAISALTQKIMADAGMAAKQGNQPVQQPAPQNPQQMQQPPQQPPQQPGLINGAMA